MDIDVSGFKALTEQEKFDQQVENEIQNLKINDKVRKVTAYYIDKYTIFNM